MDPLDPLLSHQYEAVLALSEQFNQITVITGRVGVVSTNPKIRIISTKWIPGQSKRNLIRLLLKALPKIMLGNYSSVFYHMTDMQCAVLSPFVRLRNRRQYLWYAHAFKSKYLLFSSWWVTGIVTSTTGSCPLTGKEVHTIGQAIDHEKFLPVKFDRLNFDNLIHIGRFDKSKNIDYLIETAEGLRTKFPSLKLTIVGSPANEESQGWANELIAESKVRVSDDWLQFKGSIPRDQFPMEASKNGCFFHGYRGSLDKTLIESTMMCIPVATINLEYINIFGSWSTLEHPNLEDEYRALRNLPEDKIDQELQRRSELALNLHSLRNWIEQLSKLLQ
jgi:glycosyltransferase involved in cell wall biosynthesis